MPFDFDVAMDVLEKLTPMERAAVLHAVSVILCPESGVKGAICLYGRPVGKIDISSPFEDDAIMVRDGRLVPKPNAKRKITFHCEQLYGVQMSRNERAKPIALDQIDKMVLNRKERDIL